MARAPVDVEAELSRAVVALYTAEPFFAHVLQGLVRRLDDRTRTAAVALTDDGIELRVNPDFLRALSRNERVAVLKHEVLHVVLKHLTRVGVRDRQLWNLACDVVVNEIVGRWPLPDGAVTRATFPDLALGDDLTADSVYARLKALQDDPNEAPRSGAALDGLAAAATASGDEDTIGGHSDHAAWGDADTGVEHAESRRYAASAAIETLLARAADRTDPRHWGELPAAVVRAVRAARERGTTQVDWRRALRLFAARAGRTRVVATQRRESARYGTFPGTKLRRLRTVVVAIDTSGSIGPAILDAFFREVHAIWRSGATVHVVPCDAEVGSPFPYTGQPPPSVGGGGGTAFDPVFVWLRARRHAPVDACVYLTDGHGPTPHVRPPCPVLWVVTDTTGMGPHLTFGRAIHLAP